MAYGKVLYNRSLLAVVVIETRARDRKEKVYGRKTIAKFYFSNLKWTKKKKQQQSTAEQLSESGRLTKVLSSTVQAFRADAHLDNSFDSMHDNTATFFGRREIF